MSVFIVWFKDFHGDDEMIHIYLTKEDAEAFVKARSTFGNEGLYIEEYSGVQDVDSDQSCGISNALRG